MTRTISASEAKNRLGAYLKAVEGGEDVVIANHGKPLAALIPVETYREWVAQRDRQRRADLLVEARQIRARVRTLNADLTAEEADAIAQEIRDAAWERVVERRATVATAPSVS